MAQEGASAPITAGMVQPVLRIQELYDVLSEETSPLCHIIAHHMMDLTGEADFGIDKGSVGIEEVQATIDVAIVHIIKCATSVSTLSLQLSDVMAASPNLGLGENLVGEFSLQAFLDEYSASLNKFRMTDWKMTFNSPGPKTPEAVAQFRGILSLMSNFGTNVNLTLKGGSTVTSGLPPSLVTLIQASSLFCLLPGEAQALYCWMLRILTPTPHVAESMAIFRASYNTIDSQKFFKDARRIGAGITSDSAAPDKGEKNVIRWARRVLCLAAASTCIVLALTRALEEATAGLPDDAMDIPVRAHFQSGETYDIVENVQSVTFHQLWQPSRDPASYSLSTPGQGEKSQPGVQSPPELNGSTPPQSRSDKSEAMRFLATQLAIPHSGYKMPEKNASEAIWLNWFASMGELSTMFRDLPDLLTISHIKSGMLPDDSRIYGWVEYTMRLQPEIPTLQQFVSHVRKQVLLTCTTRRKASLELQALASNFAELKDCTALSTKLKQLYTQLFPLITEEVEPMTRHQVALYVNDVLKKIRTSRDAKTDLVKAFKNIAASNDYSEAAMFRKYLDDQLHKTIADSVSVVDAYLGEVCDILEFSHRMYVQTKIPEGSKTPKQDHVQALSHKFDIPKHALAAFCSTYSGTPKRRHESNGADTQATRRNGASASAPQPEPGQVGSLRPKAREALVSMHAAGGNLMPGTIHVPGIPDASLAAVLAAGESGTCVVCQVPGHRIKDCPLRQAGKPTKTLADQFVKRFRDLEYGVKPSAQATGGRGGRGDRGGRGGRGRGGRGRQN